MEILVVTENVSLNPWCADWD